MSEPEIMSPAEVAAIEHAYAGLVPLEGKGLSHENGGHFLVPEDRFTKSGVSVSTRTAMEISAVMACATVVAEDVGKMPLQLFKWDRTSATPSVPTGRSVRMPTHPIAKLLETRPNEYMTAQDFKETLTLHAMLSVGGFAWKARNSQGDVGELWPLMPGQCIPRWDEESGDLIFDVWFEQAWGGEWGNVTVPASHIFRVTGISWDGITGINRVQLAREVFGLSKRLTEAQAKFYGKDQRPSGIVTTEQKPSAEVLARIQATWQRQFGPDGEGGVAVLDGGFKYEPMTISAKDSDSIALWRLLVEEACRIFRVQPLKVMHATGTQSYASIEQLNYAHLTDTLDPWLVRWEQQAERDLIEEGADLYWKFNRNAYLRPLPKDRFAIYQQARQSNLMSVNEIRDREELEPDDDERADDLFAPIGTNPTPAPTRTPAAAAKPTDKPEPAPSGEEKGWRRYLTRR